MISIYIIENIINHKKYIGQTVSSLTKRFNEHIHFSSNTKQKAYNSILQKAIRKYGKENFIISQLDETSDNEVANFLEEHYISWFNTYKNGYNGNSGGAGHPRGKSLSEDHKKSLSLALKGRKLSDETKQHISEGKKGKKYNFPEILKKNQLKASESKKLWWELTFPDGSTEILHGINQYCIQHELSPSGFTRVISGLTKKANYKGIKVKKL